MGELTKEHIIPLGLSGNLILPKASCRRCATITGTVVEQHCLREMLIGPRTHWKMKTRRWKERPNSLRVGVGEPTVDYNWLDVPIGSHPLVFSMPIFDRPGFVRRDRPHNSFGLLDVWNYIDPSAEEKLTKIADNAGIYNKFSPDLFCRMIAKIAHSYAVAECGLDTFIPFLPRIILGESRMISYYVGGASEPILPVQPGIMVPLTHELNPRGLASPDGDKVVSVLVHLFSSLGAPMYEVIVGRII